MSIHKEPPIQIRLLIPAQMVSELDTIAQSREVSRLSIIRRFLRHQIDEELKSLSTYLENSKRYSRTHLLLQEKLRDQEW
jgi:metal-responsive CopG/Arc/MetJ family transcriptional regulator